MTHLLETTMSFTIAGEEIEADLAVWFTFRRARPATQTDPAEPAACDMTEAYVVTDRTRRKENPAPDWLWSMLAESESLHAEMLAVVERHHELMAEYRADAMREEQMLGRAA